MGSILHKNAVSQYCYDSNINETDIHLSSITSDTGSIEVVKSYIDNNNQDKFFTTVEDLDNGTFSLYYRYDYTGAELDYLTFTIDETVLLELMDF
ncbi:MAG: hypothetical protein QG565_761 [Campylobacterota bacterium]|nr:hypothetical protein [Campylobacterota bacterium]